MLILSSLCIFTAYFFGYWLGHANGWHDGRCDERRRLRAFLSRRTRSDWQGRPKALDIIPKHERN
jgi:hypothetical protein